MIHHEDYTWPVKDGVDLVFTGTFATPAFDEGGSREVLTAITVYLHSRIGPFVDTAASAVELQAVDPRLSGEGFEDLAFRRRNSPQPVDKPEELLGQTHRRYLVANFRFLGDPPADAPDWLLNALPGL